MAEGAVEQVGQTGRQAVEYAERTGREAVEQVEQTGRQAVEYAERTGSEAVEYVEGTSRQAVEFVERTGREAVEYVERTSREVLQNVESTGRSLIELLERAGGEVAQLAELVDRSTPAWINVYKNWKDSNKTKAELAILADLEQSSGSDYPGSDYRPPNRKTWMAGLNPGALIVNNIVWPGTHDSATNNILIPIIAECQSLSVYDQLCLGVRLLDIRLGSDRRVYHGVIPNYTVDIDAVLRDLKRFLGETVSEVVILEVRTEYGHSDPLELGQYLEAQLGEHLIHQDDCVFGLTLAQLLPRRVICVWKPRDSPQPSAGAPLWGARYLRDNWTDTVFPHTKFESNLNHLEAQPPAVERNFFYRVENTLTPDVNYPIVYLVTTAIHPYARLFLKQCLVRGCADRLQVYSTDFVREDFVDACIGLTKGRIR